MPRAAAAPTAAEDPERRTSKRKRSAPSRLAEEVNAEAAPVAKASSGKGKKNQKKAKETQPAAEEEEEEADEVALAPAAAPPAAKKAKKNSKAAVATATATAAPEPAQAEASTPTTTTTAAKPKKAPAAKKGKKNSAALPPEPEATGIWANYDGKSTTGEVRQREFRTEPPSTYKPLLKRALVQRMVILDRERKGTPEQPEETVSIAGTTGNVYTVKVGATTSCNCPHYRYTRADCKHLAYVMHRVYKAPAPLRYQVALLPNELRAIFEGAPPIVRAAEPGKADDKEGEGGIKRKPLTDPDGEEIDCPICYCPMSADETIVYCQHGCGNNIHEECFNTWATVKGGVAYATCPYCRTAWAGQLPQHKKGKKDNPRINYGKRGDEGYLNVAEVLGMSTKRDTSTYKNSWRKKMDEGGDDEEGAGEGPSSSTAAAGGGEFEMYTHKK